MAVIFCSECVASPDRSGGMFVVPLSKRSWRQAWRIANAWLLQGGMCPAQHVCECAKELGTVMNTFFFNAKSGFFGHDNELPFLQIKSFLTRTRFRCVWGATTIFFGF